LIDIEITQIRIDTYNTPRTDKHDDIIEKKKIFDLLEFKINA